ncbi:hypothetical protein ACOMHN_008191 [Nucella lapillus]
MTPVKRDRTFSIRNDMANLMLALLAMKWMKIHTNPPHHTRKSNAADGMMILSSIAKDHRPEDDHHQLYGRPEVDHHQLYGQRTITTSCMDRGRSPPAVWTEDDHHQLYGRTEDDHHQLYGQRTITTSCMAGQRSITTSCMAEQRVYSFSIPSCEHCHHKYCTLTWVWGIADSEDGQGSRTLHGSADQRSTPAQPARSQSASYSQRGMSWRDTEDDKASERVRSQNPSPPGSQFTQL